MSIWPLPVALPDAQCHCSSSFRLAPGGCLDASLLPFFAYLLRGASTASLLPLLVAASLLRPAFLNKHYSLHCFKVKAVAHAGVDTAPCTLVALGWA